MAQRVTNVLPQIGEEPLARRAHGHRRRRRNVRLAQRPHELSEGVLVEQLRTHERERFDLVDALLSKLGVAQLEVLGQLVDDFVLAHRVEPQAREPRLELFRPARHV